MGRTTITALSIEKTFFRRIKRLIIKTRVFLTLVFLLSYITANSQNSSTYVNNYQSSPQSPEAAQFSNYSTVPVSTYTGVPNIQIPLGKMESDFLSLPVTMSYHAGGIKVGQAAAWTGQSWDLNLGGVITREIKDQPDDSKDINTEIVWCSDAILCRNCIDCDDDPVACETCTVPSKIKKLNQTYTDVGYLYHGEQVQDLIDKDWNSFTSEEKEFAWGSPNIFLERLTFDELDLESDIIIDIDFDDTSEYCCGVFRDLFADLVITGVEVVAVASIVATGFTIVSSTLAISVDEIIEDPSCNGELLPVLSIEDAINHEHLDCLRFNVLRPRYDFMDTEPDVWSFNFNGHSGQFVFDKEGVPRLFEESDLRIEYTLDANHQILAPSTFNIPTESIYTGAITEFKITDPQGTIYIFKDKEISFSNSETQNYHSETLLSIAVENDHNPNLKNPYRIDFENVNAAYTSWYLSEIWVTQRGGDHPDANKEFVFEYDDELLLDHSNISMSMSMLCEASGGQSYSRSSAVSTIFGKKLSKVKWKKGGTFDTNYELQLISSGNRLDYYYPQEVLSNLGTLKTARRLDALQFKIGNHILKDVKFDFSYFDKTTFNQTPPSNKPWIENHRNRLRLDKVQIGGYNEDDVYTTSPPFEFEYNQEPLPPRHSAQKDFWGYPNGAGRSLIPEIWAYPFNDPNTTASNLLDHHDRFDTPYCVYKRAPIAGFIEQGPLFPTQGNREVHEDFAKSGILEKIIYPSGGFTEFEFESNRFFDYYELDSKYNNEPLAGGLRIKSIQNSEDDAIDYIYELGGFSSGNIVDIPLFARSASESDLCGDADYFSSAFENTVLLSESFTGLGLTSGSSVGYSYVEEVFADGGKVVYDYSKPGGSAIFPNSTSDCGMHTIPCLNSEVQIDMCLFEEPNFYTNIEKVLKDNYPFPPKPNYDWKRPKLASKEFFNSDEESVQKIEYDYNLFCIEKIPGLKASQYTNAQQLFAVFQVDAAKYYYLSTDYRLDKITKTLDGITEEQRYSYDIANHHQVKSIETFNSNGDSYVTELLYPHDTDYSSTQVYIDMLNRNRIGPLSKLYKKNNTLYAGEKTEFDYFGGGPYPKEIYNYEKGSNSGVGAWATQVEFLNYENDIGKIKEMKVDGWEAETFNYDINGNIDDKTFLDFTWDYNYEPNTHLLSSVTDIDGQSTNFEYDGLQRVEWIKERDDDRMTQMIYSYQPNTIQTITHLSDQNNQSSTQTFDGLGRLLSTKNNVTNATVSQTYDNQGRINTKTDEEGKLSSFTYYPDPLNRPKTSTTPLGTATTNDPLDFVTTMEYSSSPDDEYITKVTDPDGRIKEEHTDILGRMTKSIKGDGTTTATTSYSYDDKGRLRIIVPPDATDVNGNMIPTLKYEYIYDGADNVWYSKFPDKDIIEYNYDSRDLQVAMKDGNIIDRNKGWLSTTYDDYGRPEEIGYGASPGVVTEKLIHNHYDGSGTNANVPIYKGKLHEAEINILDGFNKGTQNLTTLYTYDTSNGRMERTETSGVAEYTETYDYTYYESDLINTETHTAQNNTTITTYEYDNALRLASTTLDVNGTSEIINNNQVYNLRDQITSKKINSGSYTTSYLYNDNGWLTKINSANFNLDLYYNDSPIYSGAGAGLDKNQEGGNISHKAWSTPNTSHEYLYDYDHLSRLKTSTAVGDGNNSSYTYHGNRGNLHTIIRNGSVLGNSGEIDNLSLMMKPNTNQLDKLVNTADFQFCPEMFVADGPLPVPEPGPYGAKEIIARGTQNSDVTLILQGENSVKMENGFKYSSDGNNNTFKALSDDCPELQINNAINKITNYFGTKVKDPAGTYQYDKNGNIIYDPTKGMSFGYNHFNLPYSAIDAGDNTITWLYTADGRKLKKTTSLTDSKTYLGNMEFRNGTIEAVYHSEGQVAIDGSSQEWRYSINDHLGNRRILMDDANTILSESHYYSFGLEMYGAWNANSTFPDDSPENDYKYNGKELHNDFGLRLYEYGARFYDPAIGRFTGVDPISDQFPHASTYNYAENRPINGIDLWGLQFVDANDAKIYMHNGGAALKRNNLSKPTKYQINTARVVSFTNENGESSLFSTFPTRVGSLNFNRSNLEKRRPSSNGGVVTEVASTRPNGGNSSQRTKWKTAMIRQGLQPGSTSISPVPIGGGGKGLGALWAFSEGLSFLNNGLMQRDLNIANAQYETYGTAIERIVSAASVNLIPPELQTGQILGDIANYIFQGEFVNKYDDSTFQKMRETSQLIIMEAGIQLNCDRCQQDQK